MAYELIVLDLDDTLLDAQKRISSRNRDALLRAKENGARIILASGRAYPGVTEFNKILGNKDYTIVCGGAQVVDPDGNVIHSTYVPPIAAKQVMRWAMTRGIHFQVYLDDGYHFLEKNDFSDFYEKQCNYSGIENPDLMGIENVLASKILLIDSDEKIEQYRNELSALFPELALKTSQSYFLEVMNPDASKGNALKYLAEKLGYGREQLIAFGDSEIDESMLAYAGMGVAVENAGSACKEVADHITASCEEDGVALAIEKFILGADTK